MTTVWEPRAPGSFLTYFWVCEECVLKRIDTLEEGVDMINPNAFSSMSLHDCGEGFGLCQDCKRHDWVLLWYLIPPKGYYKPGTWELADERSR
jgi:hypothetical protein